MCLFEHLKIANRRRNIEAAHAEAPDLKIRSSEAARGDLRTESKELGEELVHMLRHISDLEGRMSGELQAILLNQ